MDNDENMIVFKEIKTYEEAYYYNSDPNEREAYRPNEREVYNSNKIKLKKNKSKGSKFFRGLIGQIVEGVLEVLFSILD